MEKKIIAVALVLVLMVTVFTACGKKYLIKEFEGLEYPLVTDDEGNTILNESNGIAFYVTNENNEIVTDDKGETQTNWVTLNSDLATDDILAGDFYRLKVPEGWEADGAAGRLEKKDSNEMCCITPVMVVPEMEDGKTYTDYLASHEDSLKQVEDGMKKEGHSVSLVKSETVITENGHVCSKYVFDAYEKDGKPIIHSESLFFVRGRTIYKMEYFSLLGVGYDKDFDFEAYLNENFEFITQSN